MVQTQSRTLDREPLEALLESHGFKVELTADYDDLSVHGNAIASGDAALDEKVETEILERLERGDVWAWAHVRVTVSIDGFEGSDSLGACSYASEADFKQPGGYYRDMLWAALKDLSESIGAHEAKAARTPASRRAIERVLSQGV